MPFSDILWNKNVWGLLILIVFIIVGIISVALAYHWRRYGRDLPIIRFMSVIFLIGVALLIILITASYQVLP